MVLSAGLNPCGSKTTNPAGIYVIDCNGQDLRITNARIHGTLIVVDVGQVYLQNGFHLQATYPNYPVLLVSHRWTTSQLVISQTTPLLEEASRATVEAPADGFCSRATCAP